jgi:hypothetical protein
MYRYFNITSSADDENGKINLCIIDQKLQLTPMKRMYYTQVRVKIHTEHLLIRRTDESNQKPYTRGCGVNTSLMSSHMIGAYTESALIEVVGRGAPAANNKQTTKAVSGRERESKRL